MGSFINIIRRSLKYNVFLAKDSSLNSISFLVRFTTLTVASSGYSRFQLKVLGTASVSLTLRVGLNYHVSLSTWIRSHSSRILQSSGYTQNMHNWYVFWFDCFPRWTGEGRYPSCHFISKSVFSMLKDIRPALPTSFQSTEECLN